MEKFKAILLINPYHFTDKKNHLTTAISHFNALFNTLLICRDNIFLS